MSILHIPDDLLQRLGRTEQEALMEIACRLYETRRLPFDAAARLAETTLEVFAEACAARKIPVYWVTEQDLTSDLQALEKMGL